MTTTNNDICGCIIAGGKSRRFRQDKGLYVYRGKPMIEHVYAAMKNEMSDILISGDDASKYSFLGLESVPDIIPGRGPIVGIYSALMRCRKKIFAVACDMPFLDSGLIRHMISASDGHDVTVPFIDGNYEPLHAIYSPSCAQHIKTLIDHDDRRIIHFFDSVSVRKITGDEIRRFCDPEKTFRNINYIEDLDAST